MCYGSAGAVCPSPPTPLQGSTGPTRSLCARDRAGPGTMCLVCGLLFLSMTRAGIFQLQGTQTQCTASRDQGGVRAVGLLGPWGSLGVGGGWPEASGPSALTLLCSMHASLCAAWPLGLTEAGREYNRPCFHEPGSQERTLRTNLASQVMNLAMWAGLSYITSLRVKSTSYHDHFCYGHPCL